MAEQHATAIFLEDKAAIDEYLFCFKSEIEKRLHKIYKCIISLKEKGFAVDAVTPQAAIYLTVLFDLVNKKTEEGKTLETQSDVTDYLLSEAKLAIVLFTRLVPKKARPGIV